MDDGVDCEEEEDQDDEMEEEAEEDDSASSVLGEGTTQLRDPSSEAESREKSEVNAEAEAEKEDIMDLDRRLRPVSQKAKAGKSAAAHPILDDGFSSLAEFNAEIEEAEARAVSKDALRQQQMMAKTKTENLKMMMLTFSLQWGLRRMHLKRKI
jgi:U3 small nucleolar RNA-associated protein MPP10